MQTYTLVRPEHLNHYGFLFGGALLRWVDENAYIIATLEYPGANFVTVAMDGVEFRKSVRLGAILRFDVRLEKQGRTSVRYGVDVLKKDMGCGSEESIFSTTITFVNVDDDGRKTPLPAGIPVRQG